MANYSGGGAAFSTGWHGHAHGPDGETTVQIEGAWTGTIFFEARTPAGATVAVQATPVQGGAGVTQLIAGEVGIWRIDSGGVEVRARFAPGTGNPTIRVHDAYSG